LKAVPQGREDTAPKSDRFDFVMAPAIGRSVLAVAKALLQQGLESAEVASLFTHAAAVLVCQEDGMPKDEWLALCAELHAASVDDVPDLAITAPGGSA
jgi:hypothetical protein